MDIPNIIIFFRYLWCFLLLLVFKSPISTSLEVIIAHTDGQSVNYLYWNETLLLEIANSLTSSVDWHKCLISDIQNCLEEFPDSLILLDLSIDIDTQYSISQICINYSIVHLVYQSKFKFTDDWTYSMVPSYNEQVEALLGVSSYLYWTQGIIFTSKENYWMTDNFLDFSSGFNFLTIESESNIDELVRKVVFRLGSTLYYVLSGLPESLKLQNSLYNAQLLEAGNGIIFNQESGYGCITEGALIITDFGYEFVNSPEEYFKSSAINLILNLLSQISNEISQDLARMLKNKLKNHFGESEFSLVNIQNGERVIVGTIVNGTATIFGNITFPGKASIIPKSTKKILHLSINAGTTNPGASPSLTQKLGSMGSYVAIDKINESHDILSNFQLDIFNYDCGVTIFNSSFATACFTNNIEKLGLTHLSSYGSVVAKGTIQVFNQLNLSLPVIGSANGDPSLSSSTNFPMYVRIVSSLVYSQSIVCLKAMGWTKAAILYENSSWGIPVYNSIIKSAENVKIEIVNQESLRVIAAGLNRTALRNYKDQIEAVVNTQARLIIMLVQCPLCNYVTEYFYDLGLRKGDILIFGGTPDILTYLSTNDTTLYKRQEIASSAFGFNFQYWIGQIGEEAKSRILSKFSTPPNSFSCDYYDAIYLAGNALDYMINRGQDYKNSTKLMAVIRETQFTGCTGKVSINKGSNDRIFDVIIIEALKIDKERNSTIYVVGKFRPFSTNLWSVINSMVYADGSTVKPSDLRNENGTCPFPTKKVKTFEKGRIVLFSVCFTVALITAVITFVIWKKWWHISVDELREKQEMSPQDFIVGLTIVVEFFQLASMGPDFSVISPFLYEASNTFSLDLGNIIEMKNGIFWIIVDGVYAGIFVWNILCIVVLFRLDEKWRNYEIFRFLAWLADYLMPILGNLCFIPFISICLDIFLCDQSIGDRFTDSFLAKDCYYFCWKDSHLIYAILSCFALLSYEPLAVFCRPLWQELQPMLHVKAFPLFLMVKTVAQTTFIVLNKTIKRSSDIGHGIIFIFAMVVYIVFVFKFKSYNYARFSLWEGLSLIGVTWLAFLSVVEIEISNYFYSTIAIISLFMGWLFIIAFGLWVQYKKYPSMLFRPRNRNTSNLFKFAFTFGKESKTSLVKFNGRKPKVVPEDLTVD
ncbi:unnamed protein product [Blepharisma stoltei]|uniref:Receptor ligand binding region domain-containing protein n=1 Tax=Blepharisma stoltei TaxID=1481888 RepID=A0AAU9IZH4_9CILI|nr:unnamed protein product [Blepharisma stoltei]